MRNHFRIKLPQKEFIAFKVNLFILKAAHRINKSEMIEFTVI